MGKVHKLLCLFSDVCMYLLIVEIKLRSTSVQRSVEIFVVCELGAKDVSDVSL